MPKQDPTPPEDPFADDPDMQNKIREQQESNQRSRAYQIWSYSDTGHELTIEEQLFIRSYCIDRNGVAALRRIGYVDESVATLKRRAERILANPEVQGAFEALAKRVMDALEITAERVNEQIASIAFFDPGQVMEFDHNGVKMMHSKYWTPAQRANVTSIKMGKDGVEIKLADRQRALDFLGKQLNLVNDENEMAKAAAAAAASAATDRILEVVGRMRDARLPPPEQGATPSVQ